MIVEEIDRVVFFLSTMAVERGKKAGESGLRNAPRRMNQYIQPRLIGVVMTTPLVELIA